MLCTLPEVSELLTTHKLDLEHWPRYIRLNENLGAKDLFTYSKDELERRMYEFDSQVKAKGMLKDYGIVVPEFYGLYPVQRDDRQRWYAVMEHIKGYPINKINPNWFSTEEYKLIEFLDLFGINHGDLHGVNVMVTDNGDLAIIDWEFAKFMKG